MLGRIPYHHYFLVYRFSLTLTAPACVSGFFWSLQANSSVARLPKIKPQPFPAGFL